MTKHIIFHEKKPREVNMQLFAPNMKMNKNKVENSRLVSFMSNSRKEASQKTI